MYCGWTGAKGGLNGRGCILLEKFWLVSQISVKASARFSVACENSRPSSLPARVAFRPSRETPLGPGAKKGGCFRRLDFWLSGYLQITDLTDPAQQSVTKSVTSRLIVQILTKPTQILYKYFQLINK